MHLLMLKALIGMLVGVLVGLTGLGSGVLLLPILIFGLGIPPIVAVGSDAIFSALTKTGAGFLHWRQRTVNWPLVMALAAGSIPGAFAGVMALTHMRALYGNGVNDFLKLVIGALLILIPLVLLVPFTPKRSLIPNINSHGKRLWVGGIAIGLAGGFLVGLSSVGSGTLVLAMIVLLTQCPPSVLVGTDIVHAVILTGFTGLLYARLGTVDFSLVAALLIGSVPGALIGARLTAQLPALWLKRVLCVGLLITGARMLLI